MSSPLPHTPPQSTPPQQGYSLSLQGLAALRILIILAIGVGYASTMNIGAENYEWGNHWGYDPSWYGVQLRARMPGLLDDAKYMCLLQGAIWTLRIGLILHLGFLIGWMTRILQNRYFVLALSVTAIAVYVTLVDTAVKIPEFGEKIGDALPAFRLGYAYLAGVAIFMWQDKLRLNGRRIIFSTLSLTLLTTVFYKWLPWSSIQEVMGVTVWLTICLGFLHHAPKGLQRCPRLSPVLYVSVWPAAQIIVALLPSASQMGIMLMSAALASLSAVAVFLILRQARIQPARL